MSYACQTCNEAVTHIVDSDGVHFAHNDHAGARSFDHDPVPVEIDPETATHVVFCDFCNAINAGSWDCVWEPFTVGSGAEVTWTDDGLYLACDDCATLVANADWDGLLAQAKTVFPDSHGSIAVLYRLLASFPPPTLRPTTIAKADPS